MVRHTLLRWAEPLFPVAVVAAGVALAPAFLMGGGTQTATAVESERYVGTPVLIEKQYVGCELGGNVYSPAVAPVWRCGKDALALPAVSREVASLPNDSTTTVR